jgi:type III secretory pathway component EscS
MVSIVKSSTTMQEQTIEFLTICNHKKIIITYQIISMSICEYILENKNVIWTHILWVQIHTFVFFGQCFFKKKIKYWVMLLTNFFYKCQ